MNLYEKWIQATGHIHQSKSMAAFDKALKNYIECNKNETKTKETLLQELRLRFKKWARTLMDEDLMAKMDYIKMILEGLPELGSS